MRNIDGSVLFSATDLMRFMGCPHAIALDLAYMPPSKYKSLSMSIFGCCHGRFVRPNNARNAVLALQTTRRIIKPTR